MKAYGVGGTPLILNFGTRFLSNIMYPVYLRFYAHICYTLFLTNTDGILCMSIKFRVKI